MKLRFMLASLHVSFASCRSRFLEGKPRVSVRFTSKVFWKDLCRLNAPFGKFRFALNFASHALGLLLYESGATKNQAVMENAHKTRLKRLEKFCQ